MDEACARAVRLVYLRDLFQSGWRGSTQELAELCGVSRRTAQRDLVTLQDEPFRVPLVVDLVWGMMEGAARDWVRAEEWRRRPPAPPDPTMSRPPRSSKDRSPAGSGRS